MQRAHEHPSMTTARPSRHDTGRGQTQRSCNDSQISGILYGFASRGALSAAQIALSSCRPLSGLDGKSAMLSSVGTRLHNTPTGTSKRAPGGPAFVHYKQTHSLPPCVQPLAMHQLGVIPTTCFPFTQ